MLMSFNFGRGLCMQVPLQTTNIRRVARTSGVPPWGVSSTKLLVELRIYAHDHTRHKLQYENRAMECWTRWCQ